MDRRQLLIGTGAVATSAIAGCADEDPAGPPAIQSVTVSDVTPVRRVAEETALEPWGRFIGSASAAREELVKGTDPSPAAFVEATDFTAGERLLFVQAYGRQTCYRLDLLDGPRLTETDRPLAVVAVRRTEPPENPCGDAITPVSLLSRISFVPDRRLPSRFDVRVRRPRAPTAELSLPVRI